MASVTITWTTDVVATSWVEYGLTVAYGSNSGLIDPALVTSHSVTLSGLANGTLYYYRVHSRNIAGTETLATGTLTTAGTFTRTASSVRAALRRTTTRTASSVTASVADAIPSTRTRPQLLIEIAFASNPNDASPSWTNVTAYAQRVSLRRGRQTELDHFEAGTATVRLNNDDRRFDPVYPGSPYSPNVKIGKRLRISAAWDGATYRLFDGLIEAWPQEWAGFVTGYVDVRVSDAFKQFSLYPLNGDYPGSVNGDGPWGYWELSGNLNDSSSHGNNGIWSGSNPSTFGNADFFSSASGYSSKYFGSDDYMTHATSGWATGGFSIETWVMSDWAGNDATHHGLWQSAVTVGLNPNNAISLFKYHNGVGNDTLQARIVSPSGTQQDVTWSITATSWPAATWRHVVLTASATAGLCLYVDNVLVAGPTYVGTLSLPTTAPSAPRWGMGFDNYANAYMAQGALFDTALRVDQVADRWKSHRLYFPSQDAPTRLGAVLDVAGWPAGEREFDGGVAVLALDNPDESLLAYMQRINDSEVGRLFMSSDGKVRLIGRDAGFVPPYTDSQYTFGDAAAGNEIPYSDIALTYDDVRCWNEIKLQRDGGTLQTARDTALQVTDIVRTYSDTNLLHSTDAQTLAAAQYRLSQYSEAVLRVDGLTIMPQKLPTLMWPVALGLEIGDRVTVVRRPQNQGTMSQQVYIEGIAHDITPSGEWTTQYTLSLADITVFWVLGDTAGVTAGVWDGITTNRSILGLTTTLSF